MKQQWRPLVVHHQPVHPAVVVEVAGGRSPAQHRRPDPRVHPGRQVGKPSSLFVPEQHLDALPQPRHPGELVDEFLRAERIAVGQPSGSLLVCGEQVAMLIEGQRAGETHAGANGLQNKKIGAQALLINLIDRGAIGLTTTHDLALTAIAEQSGGRAVNVHFEDELKDGELIFDYKMKPGPVTHSNALALMKAVGLPVNTIGRLGD